MSTRQVSEEFGVPHMTLNSHVHWTYPLKSGGPIYLDSATESGLAAAF